MKEQQKINCKSCVHYFITWDKKFPYGCRALSFKSNRMPSIDVKLNSKLDCLAYKEKKHE
ncbi:MAG: hypothetical protein Fur0015_00220 [Ignavibacteriales bacterium]